MTSRESAHDRGRRLLTEGRVTLTRVDGPKVDAQVRGDTSRAHHVTHRPGQGWRCPCEARTRCAHLVSVQLVVLTDQDADRTDPR